VFKFQKKKEKKEGKRKDKIGEERETNNTNRVFVS